LRIALLCLAFGLVHTHTAQAHPEDEFCTGDGGMDPALCRALQDLARAAYAPDPGPILTRNETIDFERPAIETLGLYIKIGVQHILPGGLDHILFVLSIFFSRDRKSVV